MLVYHNDRGWSCGWAAPYSRHHVKKTRNRAQVSHISNNRGNAPITRGRSGDRSRYSRAGIPAHSKAAPHQGPTSWDTQYSRQFRLRLANRTFPGTRHSGGATPPPQIPIRLERKETHVPFHLPKIITPHLLLIIVRDLGDMLNMVAKFFIIQGLEQLIDHHGHRLFSPI